MTDMSTVRDLVFFFLSTLTVILFLFLFLSFHSRAILSGSLLPFLPSTYLVSSLYFLPSISPLLPILLPSFLPSALPVVRPFFCLYLFLSSPLSGCDHAPFLPLFSASRLLITILSSPFHFPSSPFPLSHYTIATFSWRGLLCSADCMVIICSYGLI